MRVQQRRGTPDATTGEFTEAHNALTFIGERFARRPDTRQYIR
jgi:hypothetical protein